MSEQHEYAAAPSAAFPASAEAGKLVNVKITTLTGKVIPIAIATADTVDALKMSIESAEGIPPDFQRLIFAGRELTMAVPTLSSYNIVDGSVIHLVLRRNQPAAAPSADAPISDEEFARRLQQQELAAVSGNAYAPGMQPGVGGVAPGAAGGGVGAPHPGLAFVRGPNGEHIVLHFEDQEDEESNINRQLSKAVKMFSIIDVIFLIVWTFSYWLLALGIVLTICGYFGAKKYRPNLVLLYLVYLLLSIALRSYWISQMTDNALFCVVIGVGIAIELYIMRIVWIFFSRIRNLTDAERNRLDDEAPYFG